MAARGRVGEEGYASGCDSPAALLDDHFDKPAYDCERVDSMNRVLRTSRNAGTDNPVQNEAWRC